GFPAKFQGLNFLSAPIFVDITGDGLAEIVDGGDSSALHGFMAGGAQAALANFPKFTTGWILWSPTAGDLDSDGTVDIVANTREGYTMVWKTPGLASANTEWWRYRNDERNTGRYGGAQPPAGPRVRPGRRDAQRRPARARHEARPRGCRRSGATAAQLDDERQVPRRAHRR